MYEQLSESSRRIMETLASGAVAWRTPAEVARALGRDLESTSDELASLDVAGWIEVWDRPDGVAITLTPLAAERLGYELVESGREEMPHWEPVGQARHHVSRIVRPGDASGGCDLSHVPDGRADIPELLDDPPPVRADSKNLPPRRPAHLLGMSLIPWPGPRNQAEGQPCPVCGSRPLRPDTYCLWCDRWGGDAAKPARSGGPPAGVTLPSGPSRAVLLRQAQEDRARRKARRKARFTPSRPRALESAAAGA